MREISAKLITDTVAKLCVEANINLPCDVADRMCKACKNERNKLAAEVLSDLVENFNAAKDMNIAICQDTGMAIVFVKLGQDVHIVDGLLNEGGPATDVFKKEFGFIKTSEILKSVLFGTE